MKKLIIISVTLMVIASCATTNETRSSRIEARKEKKFAEQEEVKKAVESRRFIIKFDRLYFSSGGMMELVPRNNYIIIDGEKTILRAAYIGRQFEIRPIYGFNLRGRTQKYEMSNNSSKGIYEVRMKIYKGGESFDVNLSIGQDGVCNASVSSMKIDFVRYRGQIVPIENKTKEQPQESIMI
jgi:hypothetical protein